MLFPGSTLATCIFHKLFTNTLFLLCLYIIHDTDTFNIVRYFFCLPIGLNHHERSRTRTNISDRVKLVFTSEKHLTIDCLLHIVQYLLSIIVDIIYITAILFENIW